MKPISERLHDFWFEPAPAQRLALLRILVGAFFIWWMVPEWNDFLEVNQTDPRLYAPVGVVFHGPVGLGLFKWLLDATLLTAICFTIGLWFRFTGPLFAMLLLWLMCYRQSWSMIYHSDNLVVLHVLILGFTRAADALSLDSMLASWKRPAGPAPKTVSWEYGWPVKLMCAVVASAYFVSAVAKLTGPLGLAWATGENLRAQMAVDQIRKELLGAKPNAVSYWLYDRLWIFTILAAGSMCLEFFAPLAVLSRRVGRIWAVNTFMMHWGILLVMHITFHYQLAGVMFAPFFRVERLLEFPRGFRRRRGMGEPAMGTGATVATQPGVSRATIYYDGECGLCDRFVQFVLRHDPRELFRFATLQSEAGRAQLAAMGFPEMDLKSVILVEPDGAYDRSTATLRVCRRLSGLWPLAYGLIAVPKPIRDWCYTFITRSRKRFFKQNTACPVMPPEWRRRFVG